MKPFLAIIHDTWRQSIHQWVLITLIVLLAIMTAFMMYLPEVRTAPDGSSFLASRLHREMVQRGFEDDWKGVYRDAIHDELGFDDEVKRRSRELNKTLDEFDRVDFEIKRLESSQPDSPELKDLHQRRRQLERQRDTQSRGLMEYRREARIEADRLVDERTSDMGKMEKGVEYWMASSTYAIYLLSMLGFIAACSVYIPNMLETGSVDLVLSKPVRRWQLYLGKYVGGLVLYSVALFAAFVALFVWMGTLTGVWHWAVFGALPMTVFSLALLYAIIAWVGLWTRSTAMSMVIGYVYYLVVDTAIGNLERIPFLSDYPLIEKFAAFIEYVFPSFVWLRESGEAAVMSVFVFPWHHVIVGFVWLLVCLGTAYNRFRINDY